VEGFIALAVFAKQLGDLEKMRPSTDAKKEPPNNHDKACQSVQEERSLVAADPVSEEYSSVTTEPA
jgi:hypothetical protein